MPVKLDSKLPRENEAKIEIIPLIDIMFFLLASFMLVSLSMATLKSVKVDLPTAAGASPDSSKNLLSLSVDKNGTVFYEQVPVGPSELAARVSSAFAEKPQLRVFISGDRQARHGDILRVLDIVRGSGVEKVAFEIRPAGDGAQGPEKEIE